MALKSLKLNLVCVRVVYFSLAIGLFGIVSLFKATLPSCRLLVGSLFCCSGSIWCGPLALLGKCMGENSVIWTPGTSGCSRLVMNLILVELHKHLALRLSMFLCNNFLISYYFTLNAHVESGCLAHMFSTVEWCCVKVRMGKMALWKKICEELHQWGGVVLTGCKDLCCIWPITLLKQSTLADTKRFVLTVSARFILFIPRQLPFYRLSSAIALRQLSIHTLLTFTSVNPTYLYNTCMHVPTAWPIYQLVVTKTIFKPERYRTQA